jgi:hypothetical protein
MPDDQFPPYDDPSQDTTGRYQSTGSGPLGASSYRDTTANQIAIVYNDGSIERRDAFGDMA